MVTRQISRRTAVQTTSSTYAPAVQTNGQRCLTDHWTQQTTETTAEQEDTFRMTTHIGDGATSVNSRAGGFGERIGELARRLVESSGHEIDANIRSNSTACSSGCNTRLYTDTTTRPDPNKRQISRQAFRSQSAERDPRRPGTFRSRLRRWLSVRHRSVIVRRLPRRRRLICVRSLSRTDYADTGTICTYSDCVLID